MLDLPRWPHQVRGLHAWQDSYDRGVRRVCLSCPTGGGKTLVIADVIRTAVSLGKRVALFSNRKILVDQIVADLIGMRIPHGVRAASYEEDLALPVQICSMQTEVSRVVRRRQWEPHVRGPGDVMILDEGHLHATGHALAMRQRALDAGGFTLDVTATPIDMAHVCDQLIVTATNAELRQCGAHLRIDHYAPDEPDTLPKPNRQPSKVQAAGDSGDDLSENQQRALMGAVVNGQPTRRLSALYGRIWPNFQRINPDAAPFICFGPGVNESMWIAKRFTEHGVRTAHIDGQDIWLDGELHRKTDALWEEVLSENRKGTLPGLCCRFVLREGFNAPWLKHGIMATVFGSVQSYLQAGGRLSRFFPGYESKTLQDHGGNFWRHGSLNADRVWTLAETASAIFHKRADRIREKKERPPVVCPECGRVLLRRECPCGHVVASWKMPRAVLTEEGTLTYKPADYFPPVRRSTFTEGRPVLNWIITWNRACSAKWNASYRQAEADYMRNNNGYYPNRAWPLFPLDPDDLYRRVLDVPVDRLRGAPDLLAKMRAYQESQLAKLKELRHGDTDQEASPPAEVPAEDGTGQERQG